MFITTTQAGGSWAVSLWQYLFYIRIPDLHSYKTINQFTARLCKKIYRIYFRILNRCERNHCVNNKLKYIIIPIHNTPVHNYSAIYIFISPTKNFDSSSLYKIWLHTDHRCTIFLRPCINIAINFMHNLYFFFHYSIDTFPGKLLYRLLCNKV